MPAHRHGRGVHQISEDREDQFRSFLHANERSIAVMFLDETAALRVMWDPAYIPGMMSSGCVGT